MWFMAVVVGLLWSINSNVKDLKKQIKAEAYERNGFYKKPFDRRKSKSAEITQPLPKIAEGDSGRD